MDYKNLKTNPSNPRRITNEQFTKLMNSISTFTKMLEVRPIAYDEDGIIWGGNMRYQALMELNKQNKVELKPEYFKELTGYTIDEKREFAIRDNIELGGWDDDILANEWSDLPLAEWGIDTTGWQTEEPEFNDDYSQKLGEVIYEPKDTNHSTEILFTPDHRFDEEIEKIKDSHLKEMLKARTAYFAYFDFPKIADYYAYQATPEEQRIFEKLALVLLDKDQLVENGFSKLMESITDPNDTYDK